MINRPALKTLIPYAIGIYTAKLFNIPSWLSWIILLTCAIGLLIPKTRKPHLITFGLFASGMVLLRISLTSPIPPDFYEQQIQFSGNVAYQPELGQIREKCYATGKLRLATNPDRVIEAKIQIQFRDELELHYFDRIELEGILRKPISRRSPGSFDYRFFLEQNKIFGIIYLSRYGKFELIPDQSGFFLLHWTENLRIHTENIIEKIYKSEFDRAIVKGVLLGNRRKIDEDILRSFRNSGSLHILAVSGLHVGLVAGFFMMISSLVKVPHKIRLFITIFVVWLYVCIVGFRISGIRAATMFTIYVISRLIDRDSDIFNTIAFVALLFLLFNPLELWGLGFQLSFVAVTSILYFMAKFDRLFDLIIAENRTLRYLLAPIGFNIAAQLGTIPIVAYHFNNIAFASFIAGPFIMLLPAPIVGLSLLSVSAGTLQISLATPIAQVNNVFTFSLLKIIEFFGKIEITKVSKPHLASITIYVAIVLGVANFKWLRANRKITQLLGLSVLAIGIWSAAWRENGDLMEVTFLDVGQGDSAFVRFPDGKTMLIDGGVRYKNFDRGERVIEPFLRHEGIRKIDLMVLSHPDNDHGGGLAHILENFQVDQVLGVPHRKLKSSVHEKLHEIIDREKIPHGLGRRGKIALTPTAEIQQIYPKNENSIDLTDKDVNNDSVVLKISYGKIDFLFTGDIGRKTELKILNEGLRSEVLKVPHHGSRTSSSEIFLDRVNPQCAIFSVGARNRYRHPSKIVLKRYEAIGAKILRTDRLGTITILTDGQSYWLRHFLGGIKKMPALQMERADIFR